MHPDVENLETRRHRHVVTVTSGDTSKQCPVTGRKQRLQSQVASEVSSMAQAKGTPKFGGLVVDAPKTYKT